MPETIITIYCFFDELLKALGHKDDTQAQLGTAEVMTIATVATEFFTGNQVIVFSALMETAAEQACARLSAGFYARSGNAGQHRTPPMQSLSTQKRR